MTCLLLLSACGKSDDAAKKDAGADAGDAQPAVGVTLSAEQIDSLGLTTAPAVAARYADERSGYGTVVALDTIAQADSDYLSTRATAAQSQAAARRAQYLFTAQGGAVSRESMEAAIAKAEADQASLGLARRKAEAVFGHDAPWEKDNARSAIMGELASGKLVLVRVTFPLGALNDVPASLALVRLGGGGKRWTSTRIWEAPADPAFPGHGIFALVDGGDLAQNDHVTGLVPAGAPQDGVSVPATALVFGDGASWVYLDKGKGHYLRMQVDTGRRTADGYFLPASAGVAVGQPVVVNGAGLLLARELNPSTAAAD
jgi:multidrug efflux pump subunit AcrA (membrane-fusion protein)